MDSRKKAYQGCKKKKKKSDDGPQILYVYYVNQNQCHSFWTHLPLYVRNSFYWSPFQDSIQCTQPQSQSHY